MIQYEVNDAGLTLIEEFEGFSATPYRDIAGVWTIGFGHAIKPGEKFTSLTRETAAHLLYLDAQVAWTGLNKAVTQFQLSQNAVNALVSFIYNVGVEGFTGSPIPALLNAGNLREAAQHMLLWVHAGKVVSEDLVRRRQEETTLMLTPDASPPPTPTDQASHKKSKSKKSSR